MRISVINLNKSFKISKKNSHLKPVLKDINFTFEGPKTYFLLGVSGSGKSTLLSLLGLLDTPTSGEILFDDKKIENVQSFIGAHISFVFQEYNLFEDLSVYDNLCLYENDRDKISKYLEEFNCNIPLDIKVKYLSGGEKQRLAILRSYIKGGDIFLLDEPTGNLDKENSTAIMNLIKSISKDKLVIIVSHNEQLAFEYGDEIISLKDGMLTNITNNLSKLNLDFKTNGKNALKQLYNLINTSKNLDVIVDGEEISLNEENYIKFADKIYEKYSTSNIVLTIKKQEIIERNSTVKQTKQINNSKFLIKYSTKNILSKVGRTISSSTAIALSTMLLFLTTNFSFYNVGYHIEKNARRDLINYTQVEELYNSSTYSDGITLHQYVSTDDNYYPTVAIARINDNQRFSLLITDNKTIKFDGKEYDVPSNSVLVTDYLKVSDSKNVTIKSFIVEGFSDYLSNDIILPLNENVIQTHAEEYNSNLGEDGLYNLQNDRFCFGFTSKQYFLDKVLTQYLTLERCDLSLPFDHPQFNLSRIFEKYDGQTIISGNSINGDNEILVSKYYVDYDYVKVGDVIQISPLSSFRKKEIFGQYVDFSLVWGNSVKVVGVVDDQNEKSIYCSTNAYENLFDQIVTNNLHVFINVLNGQNKINHLYDVGVRAIDNETCFSEIYVFGSIFAGQGYILLLILSLIFIVVAALILLVWIINVIKDKFREIAIMKCLGLNNKQIYSSFLGMISILSIVSSLLGIILGSISTILIEKFIVSSFANVVVYSIFTYNIFSFVFPIIFAIIFPILMSLIFFNRISKIEPYSALKEFK